MIHQPPRLATQLLSSILVPSDRDAVLGDLCEEHALRASASPPAAARWYWQQALGSLPVLLIGRARHDRWISTVAVAIGAYVIVGAINAAGMSLVRPWVAASTAMGYLAGAAVGLAAIAGGAHLASRVRPAAGPVLGAMVMVVAVLMLVSPVDASPAWFQLIFLVLGPLAARRGAARAGKKTALMVAGVVVLGFTVHAHQDDPAALKNLVATKQALYDSNFRNDRDGLRTAIARAQQAATTESVRAMALYYAAWGEWALSHSELQAGEMPAAQATLIRGETAARAALALRPDDAEFVVMLANVLIWRLVADAQQFPSLAPEVRTLRDRARALQPENPRALIMEAGLIFNAPPDRGGDRAKGLALWTRAITLFEREAAAPSSDPLRPDWGLALSYAWVCDLHLAMRPRQVDEARAAARKALALRPDFWYVNEVITPRLQ